MSIRETIRQFLDASEDPRWAAEIISHLREQGYKVKPCVISGMVLDGALVKLERAGQPSGYSVGVRPRPRVSAEERQARRTAYEANRSAQRRAERRAQGKEARPARQAKSVTLASSHATVGGESVAEFLARGGSIERLPGFQRDNVYPQRRPTWAANNRVITA
jgi:hypothetical protein